MLRLPSYAKINFGLIIKGKRRDGFHEIETILQQIDLKDEIKLEAKEEPVIKFYCDNSTIPTGNSNLCVRAAYLLKQSVGVRKGVEIVLKKSIPAGAGLGGGSSNGAVVLLGLNKLWNLNLKPERLQVLASQLGSDVPFFIHGGAALAQGKGEILIPLKFQDDFTILIVFPQITVSTQWAYGQVNLSLTIKKKNIKLNRLKDMNYLDADFLTVLQNELEAIVFKRYPILRLIKKELYRRDAIFVGMSGSGSAIFGIFRNESKALELKEFFRDRYPAYITRPIRWGFGQLN
ncbi:MAG: 4-(cytidine 5'-diphospho)-2-C-methyl-D-erythritol kinase [bacterium]